MLLTYPLMAAIQEISGRIGRVTGHGIAGNVCRNFSAPTIWALVILLFIANTINIAADLGAMADSLKLLIGGPRSTLCRCVRLRVRTGADLSRIQTLRRDPKMADPGTFRICHHACGCESALGGGASRAAGAERQMGRRVSHDAGGDPGNDDLALPVHLAIVAGGRGAAVSIQTKSPSKSAPFDEERGVRAEFGVDTLTGMAVSNIIAIAIIITTAATLHVHGKTNIETSAQAAEALRPLAGGFAELIFALGIIGTGLLAIPVLAGSAAYAIGEGYKWPVGLSRKPRARCCLLCSAILLCSHWHRPQFHGSRSLSRHFTGAPSSTACLAPPVMVLVMLLVCSKKVMGELTGRGMAVLAGLAGDSHHGAFDRRDGV